ncbi:MAG: hypothetical protein J5647_14235 [Spirochaetaceae bacterium]|nr:hypothetical protein [Spirochaetaceae bacterium]
MMINEFANKVFAMRQAQKRYFRCRLNEDLKASKQLEKEVDEILLSLIKPAEKPPKQLDFFQ